MGDVSPDHDMTCAERAEIIRRAGAELLRVLETGDEEGRTLVPYAFLRKSLGLLDAVLVLVESDHPGEAQVLARVLVETRIDLEYFLMLAEQDHVRALARVLDAKMLDKLKALRATDFKLGERQVDKEGWEQIEKEIRGRHTDEEIDGLKKHGFAGVSLEARAVKTGNKELYDLAYRLYSGHVHATEIHEQLIRRLNPELSKGFEETLVPAVREIAINCVWVVVDRINRAVGDPLGICS